MSLPLPSAIPAYPIRSRSLAALRSDPLLSFPAEIVVPRLAVAEQLTLLVAREKAGKSTFARAAAVAVSWGAPFLGERVTAGVVLWLVMDETLRAVHQSLVALGANEGRVFLLQPAPAARFEERAEALRAEVLALRPRLVVIDTLATYAEGGPADESSAGAWTQLLGQLRRLAEEARAAVLLVHHATKREGGYRGSTAIGAGVDQIVEMQEDDERPDVRVMKCRGRWGLADFAVRREAGSGTYLLVDEEAEGGDPGDMDGGRSSMARGATSPAGRAAASLLSDPGCSRMLAWLREHPGAGKTLVTMHAGCRAGEARGVFEQMLRRGLVRPAGRGYAVAADLPSPASAPDVHLVRGDDPGLSAVRSWGRTADSPGIAAISGRPDSD